MYEEYKIQILKGHMYWYWHFIYLGPQNVMWFTNNRYHTSNWDVVSSCKKNQIDAQLNLSIQLIRSIFRLLSWLDCSIPTRTTDSHL